MNPGTIRQRIEDIALEKLGNSFVVLPLLFNVEANDSRSSVNGISVLWGEMSENRDDGIDQKMSVSQEYSLRVVCRTFVGTTDQKSITRVDEVYNSVTEVLNEVVFNRMSLPGITNVRFRGVSKPSPLNDQRDILSMEARFSVSFITT